MKKVMMLIFILWGGLFFSTPNILKEAMCQSNAQIGAKVGDWVKYSVNASETLPEYKDSEWIKVEVDELVGTNVTVQIVNHFANGTEKTETQTTSVTEAGFVISSNLKVGDSIKGTPPLPEVLNVSKILTKNYFGVDREVVLFNYTTETKSATLYYDRATGFLLEEYYRLSYWEVEYSMALSPTTTNLWSAAQPPPSAPNWLRQISEIFLENYLYVIFAVILVILVIVIISYSRSRSKKSEQYDI